MPGAGFLSEITDVIFLLREKWMSGKWLQIATNDRCSLNIRFFRKGHGSWLDSLRCYNRFVDEFHRWICTKICGQSTWDIKFQNKFSLTIVHFDIVEFSPAIISNANAFNRICRRRNFKRPRVMYGFELLRRFTT